MFSLLAASNKSFLPPLFGLVVSFGSTPTNRRTQFSGNRPTSDQCQGKLRREHGQQRAMHLPVLVIRQFIYVLEFSGGFICIESTVFSSTVSGHLPPA